MMKRSKKYQEARKLIEKEAYLLDEAIELVKKTSVTKFDSSVEVHFHMGLDPKQAEQNIRTSVTLPGGTGKEVRVVAFVGEDKVKEAKDAGADAAGTEELVEKIAGGWLDFDVAVASPDQMKGLGKIAKTLGQKGLMPNPKTGTVTLDIAKAIAEIKMGRVEVRVDKLANIHLNIGKVSFDDAKLKENLVAVVHSLLENKPANSKGTYIKSMTLATAMGPGVPVDVASATEAGK
ncbi:50S ribosomal protein L1 [Patescibacteria group bacterium]|nr:50S ribosomal protein L1 [Patescibacteria group bacterium]